MSEPSQAFQSVVSIPSEHILALAWNIATEPKIYRELVSNPYSALSLQFIAARFPDEKPEDVIKAVALAEPEGMYDWNVRQLPEAEQASETARQLTLSAHMRERLLLYAHTYAREFAHLPREFVYASLSIVVFETAEVKIIEQKYAQIVRRDLRLLIVQAIEDIQLAVPVPQHRTMPDDQANSVKRIITLPVQRLGLLGVVVSVFAFILFSPTMKNIYGDIVKRQQPSDSATTSRQEQQVLGSKDQRASGAPVRLVIPKINVDAAIQYVASTSEGTMGVPDNTTDVGWYKLGPRPGEDGSAVVAGHLNGTDGGAGVFVDLHKLARGDIFSIEDDNGVTSMFKVRETRIYNPGYAEAVFSKNDGKYVNLITCDGAWDETTNDYSKRLVVFAELAN